MQGGREIAKAKWERQGEWSGTAEETWLCSEGGLVKGRLGEKDGGLGKSRREGGKTWVTE